MRKLTAKSLGGLSKITEPGGGRARRLFYKAFPRKCLVVAHNRAPSRVGISAPFYTGEGQWLGGGVGRVPGSSLDPGWAPCLLAEELVHAGWEKCWSRRENRPYYFNRFTNQSLWEMPVLGQHDVIVSASLGQGSWRLLASGPSPNVPRAAITYLALCQDLGTQCQARQTQSCPHGTYTSVGETDT